MEWIDFIFPVMAVISVGIGSYFRKTSPPKEMHVYPTEINVVPSPTEKKSSSYNLGFVFQSEMLKATPVRQDIDGFIEELTNPQGNYSDAKEWETFEETNKKYFGPFQSWANFKKVATPEQVEEFNEGRQDATAEYYRGLANTMAFDNALERSDDKIISMQKALDEVYLTHHTNIDAHALFEKAFDEIESTDK